MDNFEFVLDLPLQNNNIIKVIGVGGAGGNALSNLFKKEVKDVNFVICNTDKQDLNKSLVPNKLQLGAELTKGLGAGGNPDKGRQAALESKNEIEKLFEDNTQMVFITAGMGGGTGTGAAPEIAKIAREKGVLTVGVVILPFDFEGKKRKENAMQGLKLMEQNTDAIIVILNERIFEFYGNKNISDAFAICNDTLIDAVLAIIETITKTGEINVDFEDVKNTLSNSGYANISIGIASGENRAEKVIEEALNAPLLQKQNIQGAKSIIMNVITSEKDFSISELEIMKDKLQEFVKVDAENFYHGICKDSSLEDDTLKVILVATGFDDSHLQYKNESKVLENTNDETGKEDTSIIINTVTPTPEISYFDVDTLLESIENNKEEEEFGVGKEVDLTFETFDFTLNENDEVDEEKEEINFRETDSTYNVGMNNSTNSYKNVTKKDEKISTISNSNVNNQTKTLKEGLIESKAEIYKANREKRREEYNNKTKQGQSDNKPYDYKEMIDKPAFIRGSIALEKVPDSSKSNISKFYLNDDDDIIKKNAFFHDKPD